MVSKPAGVMVESSIAERLRELVRDLLDIISLER